MSAVETSRTSATGASPATVLGRTPVRLPTPEAAPPAPVCAPPDSELATPASADFEPVCYGEQETSEPASADFDPVCWSQDEPVARANPDSFTDQARAVFDRVDRDDDGYLSQDEVDAAMVDPAFTGPEAAAVATLSYRLEVLEERSNDELGDENDGVTRSDLRDHEDLAPHHGERRQIDAIYGTFHARIRQAASDLFPYGDAGIISDAVLQGQLGDCYFLAALASQADADPQAIRDMIRTNPDGTYTVTFPGHDPVTITRPTDAELGRYVNSTPGLWVPVLEKAYAAMRRRDDLITLSGGRRNIDGDTLGQGIADMTGHSSTTRVVSLNGNNSLRDEIRQAVSQGRIVTASIRNLLWGDTRAGLPAGHAYSVLGVDADGNIRIRNPWGTGGPNGDGTYTFTPDQFGSRFTLVELED